MKLKSWMPERLGSWFPKSLFAYVHLFIGTPPSFFEGIVESLDVFPRCGGSKVSERMPYIEPHEDRQYTRCDIERALASAKVPKYCIVKLMMDS